MDVKIRSISHKYAECIISDNNTTLESGTMNQQEIKALSLEFLDAIDQLLFNYHFENDLEVDEKIVELREMLETI